MTTDVPRIDPAEARERSAGGDALLVCAYDDEPKCRSMLAQGALTLAELERRKPTLDARDEIIMYCA